MKLTLYIQVITVTLAMVCKTTQSINLEGIKVKFLNNKNGAYLIRKTTRNVKDASGRSELYGGGNWQHSTS